MALPSKVFAPTMEAIREGKQVLYLLPEIVLTTQLTERLRRVFGSRLGIYHSKYSDAKRVEVYRKQLSDEPYICGNSCQP